MRKYTLLIVCVATCVPTLSQNSYQKAWTALNSNDRASATVFLKEAQQDPHTQGRAYITSLLLQAFNRNEERITGFADSVYEQMEDPYPYIYALWFNRAVTGPHSVKKKPHQLKLLHKLTADNKAPVSLRTSANYVLAYNELLSGNFSAGAPYIQTIHSIRNWQYAGPFENLSGSGFYNEYAPLKYPEPESVFKNASDDTIKWFTPAFENNDGWMAPCFSIPGNTGIVYAQTFVDAPEEKSITLNMGFSGNLKLWLNDQLMILEPRERLTDLDAYSVKGVLKQGTNRILVQLGYTNNDYSSFTLRLLDEEGKPLDVNGSPVYKAYPRQQAVTDTPALLPHFAEQYFEDQLSGDSSDLLSYVLLASCYSRSKKTELAKQVIRQALVKAPGNTLLRSVYINILSAEGNNTLLEAENERLMRLDSNSEFAMNLSMQQLNKNQKYTELENKRSRYIQLYGENEISDRYAILAKAKDKKLEDIINIAEKMYQRYPDNPEMQTAMYELRKATGKGPDATLGVYEQFFKNNFHYDVFFQYLTALLNNGKKSNYQLLLEQQIKNFPHVPQFYVTLSEFFLTEKQYDKAEKYVLMALAISPYADAYWKLLGDVRKQKNEIAAALEAYHSSLKYNPDQYELIISVRKLEEKSEAYKLLPVVDEDKIINSDDYKGTDKQKAGYYFLLDQRDVVLYPDGGNEQYVTSLIKIVNEKGIERYKEVTLNSESNQSLLIEKSEVIKKDKRIQGEKNGRDIVFTNLEPGDIVFIRYRLQQFADGHFAKDFTDRYFFTGDVYCYASRYTLLAPADAAIGFRFSRDSIRPQISKAEDFTKYSWDVLHSLPEKEEPLMPGLVDVANVMYVSTIADWNKIAAWYADVVNYNEIEPEVTDVYNTLFPAGAKSENQFAKAWRIYNYIENNIHYSSVAFRQSGYIPQKPSVTLNTQLGDCKDLSRLFVALCHKAGIAANMVLIDTRNNGNRDMLLPAMDFNHCIARAMLDNKEYFIELTDNNLPFTALSNNLCGALMLDIPVHPALSSPGVMHLHTGNRSKDKVVRFIEIRPKGTDLLYYNKIIKSGHLAADVRADFRHNDEQKRLRDMEESVARGYSTGVKLSGLKFAGLDGPADSVQYEFSYVVNDQVSEVGAINAFKINYHDVVATMDQFPAEERTLPVEYWSYENTDAYETRVTVFAPEGMKFTAPPASVSLTFKDLEYTLRFQLMAPGRLQVIRKFSNSRQQFYAPGDYEGLRSFFEKIVKAEQKFIGYQ
ncbi:transglutaminase [Niabella ginsenosidivorans]|uniref:Transglutaminase n=2 Tax=Niabella ginsenosidivorans TaxID=1176587 RepID=A0A1A9I1V2_9BACT|nr:transglutaminase [Niabella ginsenosidivorans]